MHFVGIIFGNNIEETLEQFSEELEVEPYIQYTKEQLLDIAKEKYSKYIDWQEEVSKKDPNYVINFVNKQPKNDQEYLDWYIKDEGIEVDENGNSLVTYNENGEYDWYTIGGRWEGFLKLLNGESTDMAKVEEVDFNKTDIPYCYITEDGEWVQSSFDNSFKDDFINYAKNCNQDTVMTVIDFHD